MHFVAQRHVQGLNLARYLSADANLFLRFYRTVGQHRLFQVTGLRYRCDIPGRFCSVVGSEVEK
ncbi:hypothetical protein D3C76_1218720 [compost metagenome]